MSLLYIIGIYFNKYTLHVLCTHFNIYDCREGEINYYYYYFALVLTTHK